MGGLSVADDKVIKVMDGFFTHGIGPNGTSTLTFNITNSAGDPKPIGIAFSDTLPPGLQFASVIANASRA